ncbi:MAG TPA: hypothetical protein VNS79_02670 [Sphingobium sp.]|nr:hypothetical protein [Sphingobium sp.]
MGGINSGRQRSVHRGAVEQFPAIDLRILRRAGLLRPGECTYDTLRWQNQAPEALSVRIFIDLSDIGDASMRIVGAVGTGTINQRVAIECVPCPYGGVRCYFLCPVDGVRCQQLFLADGQFASRKAHRLTYASQSEDDLSRIRRKAHRLRRQVEGDGHHPRVRGRNRWRKMQQLRAAEFDARTLYLDRLRGLVENIL